MKSVDMTWNRVICASNAVNDFSFVFAVATVHTRNFHVQENEVQVEVIRASEDGHAGQYTVVYANEAQQIRDAQEDG